MHIQDGTGKGYQAEVNAEHRLQVGAVTYTAERHSNEAEGNAYQVLFSQSPTAGDDCIFYMVNSSQTMNLIAEGIWLYVSAAGEVSVKLGAKGTRNSATALTPVNCNAGSGNSADGTFEKGADLDGGSATLTGGSIVSMYKFSAATDTKYFNFEQDIIVPQNQTLTLWCSSASPTVTGHLVFNYHS